MEKCRTRNGKYADGGIHIVMLLSRVIKKVQHSVWSEVMQTHEMNGQSVKL